MRPYPLQGTAAFVFPAKRIPHPKREGKQEEPNELYHPNGRGRKGIVTKELQAVAEKENMAVEKLMELVAGGKVAIPANKNHTCLNPNGIGNALKTKINVNLGTSKDCLNMDAELEKVHAAEAMGAEAIMDLSSFGDTRTFRRKLTAECTATLGTVPIYDAIVYYNKPLNEITSQEWLDVARMHAEDGVDFMTIHCGINKSTAARFQKAGRLTNIVSRGGSLIFSWMAMTGNETPSTSILTSFWTFAGSTM